MVWGSPMAPRTGVVGSFSVDENKIEYKSDMPGTLVIWEETNVSILTLDIVDGFSMSLLRIPLD